MNSASRTPDEQPSRLPIYLSALVMPGIGQLMQRRWLAGISYSLTFAASFIFLFINLTRAFISYFQLVLSDGTPIAVKNINVRDILLPLGFGLVIYVIGLCDTYIAYLKECRAYGQHRLENKLSSVSPAIVSVFFMLAITAGAANTKSIHQAISAGDLIRVDAILEGSTGAVHAVAGNGITPLHLAAAMNQPAIMTMLLARGADIKAVTGGGFTPLHWAAGKDAAEAAQLLIRMGADVNAVAAKDITPLHWAASKNATNVVRLLIVSGARIDAKTENGMNPLHWAVMNSAMESQYLLAYRAASTQPEKSPEETVEKEMEPEVQEEQVPEEVVEARRDEKAAFSKTLIVPLGKKEELSFVWIPDLRIWAGKYEVTNGQFRRFRQRHDSLFREGFSLNGDHQPAVLVSWKDASAFCNWLNKNYADKIPPGCEFRLPGDAEWILMAKAGDNRKYPWGNQWPPAYGNFSDLSARKALSDWQGISGYDDTYVVSCPVDNSGANELGIYGLAGNVWEWCDDWFDSKKVHKVRHGGGWDFDEQPSLAILFKGFDLPDTKDDTIGFRVVVGVK